MRTVFAWSYRALPAAAARMFRLLGMHPGPEFGVHATAALAGVSVGRTRQLLDSLVGARLVEQAAPDRYAFHDLLRAYAIDQVRHGEPPHERDAALRRVLDWYLHTAAAAARKLRVQDPGLSLDPPQAGVAPLAFSDHDAAVDWAEREHANLLQAVRDTVPLGHDRLGWQLCEVLWLAQFPSAADRDWISVSPIGLKAAERAGDRGAQGRLLTQLGKSHTGIGRLMESLECHTKALPSGMS